MDTIVIGSGIAGLYYAYKHLRGKKFKILEKNTYIGGRILTTMFHGQSIVLGAGVGRFHKDVLFKRLLKELDIPIKRTTNTKNVSIEDIQFVKTVLRVLKKFHKQNPNYPSSFEDIVVKLFNLDVLMNFVAINGYSDFVKEDYRETLYHYGIEDNVSSMDIFQVPWDLLIDRLVEQIGIDNIITDCYVESICKSASDGTFMIHSKTTFNAKHIVVATDITGVHKLFPNNLLYKYVSGQPFSRIYVKIRGEQLVDGYTIVRSPLQKIIPISIQDGIYMIAYNDNENAIYTRDLPLNKLIELTGKDGKEINVIDHTGVFWTIGTHYFKPYFWKFSEWPKYLNMMRNPEKNVKVIGEAFSFNQGWVEGALESVDK